MAKKIRLTAFLTCEIDEEFEVLKEHFDHFFEEYNRLNELHEEDLPERHSDLYFWLDENRLRSKILHTSKFGCDAVIENVYEYVEDATNENS
jgi:hypothetical protein